MSASSINIRACVLRFGSSSVDRESFPVRTCARLRWRAHGEINPGSQQARNPASHQSVATTPLAGNWITTFLPEWRSLRTAFERTLNPFARAVRIFSREGHRRLNLNLLRRLKAAGSLSFLHSLVQFCQEPASVSLIFSGPSLSLFAGFHVAEPNKEAKAACAPKQSVRSIEL